MVYRDSSGRSLTEYPRPSIAVDTAVLTVPDGFPLSVLVVRDPESRTYRLPGTFLHEGERLADAVERSLRAKTGLRAVGAHQLRVFDAPQRDDRGWVLSVAHLAAVPARKFEHVDGPYDRLGARGAGVLPPSKADATPPALQAARDRDIALIPVEKARGLDFDHDEIVRRAVEHMRREYRARPDPFRLLPSTFTLRELHLLHEAVAGTSLPRDSFRRTMEQRLYETGSLSSGHVGKPAREFSQSPSRANRGTLR
ncbi:NUDIX hydrolase [Microbacterium sp. P5_E9]